ncbi:adenine nucleotide alpha hydrolase family protein [Streptomyces sasae]|uniref:hypothetical protein n=1 Tax=Streptomyces sasae TaxID=1266772 RepID=UPI00292EC18B|nr:hypothetical protein [Streptomyces sasae]
MDEQEALEVPLRPWREKVPSLDVRAEAVVGQSGAHLVDASRDKGPVVVGSRKRRTATVGSPTGPVLHEVVRYAVAPTAVVPHG